MINCVSAFKLLKSCITSIRNTANIKST